jgi:bacterioferritin-associated ferredoxin
MSLELRSAIREAISSYDVHEAKNLTVCTDLGGCCARNVFLMQKSRADVT